MKNLKDLFLLDPDITYLNHGSFGACSRSVFETYQEWQRKLENQPCHFFISELLDELKTAREELGAFVNERPDNLVYIPNATFGINAIARSLPLEKNDEVLATDHEYGSCDYTWEYVCQKRNAKYIKQHIPLPLTSKEDFTDLFWQAVTPRTKVIFISHITSSTAQFFPVEEICARARKANIITVVDGAHTIGQVPLDLQKIGADFYVSNAHKWLCAPKGAAFLFARPEVQHLLEPLIISWGWKEDGELSTGKPFLDYYQWIGTNDLSSYLSVPAAIKFQKDNHWPSVRMECHELLKSALRNIEKLTGCPSTYSDDSFYHQMAVFQLPHIKDIKSYKTSLYEKYRIEIPSIIWNNSQFIRISVQGYNTQSDTDRLLEALKETIQ